MVQLVHTIDAVRDAVADARRRGLKVGLVPTMGALHEGHGSLIEAARRECGYVVVSIFVNPLQFGPTEDYDKYPRSLQRDAAYCEEKGADLVFAPEVQEMYPSPSLTSVAVEKITDTLCGASRPGHFRGVATVVTKLFNIVLPDVAYFGQKDAQQAAVIKRMVSDLNFPLSVAVVPTFREPDGLAMSSRNRYLSQQDRQAALVLYRSLQGAVSLLEQGERQPGAIRSYLRSTIEAEPRARLDYADVVDPDTMQPVADIQGDVLLVVAAYFGEARLIDNMLFRCP
ncbi:MAG: pantoate--beta-alanine ligase [Limnochordia bacterium]